MFFALPAVAVDRRAERPARGARGFLAGGAARDGRGRVAWPARDDGELLRRARPEARLVHGIRGVPEGDVLFPALRLAARRAASVPAEGWAVVTEAELYAGVVRRRGARPKRLDGGMLRDLSELKVGDPVVHEQHGIGRFQGLTTLKQKRGRPSSSCSVRGRQALRPGRTARRHRPLAGLAEEAPLHKLGSGQWDKAKERAAKQVRDTAAELLALYAKRAARLGHAFPLEQRDLGPSAGFGFEETPTRPRRSSRS